MYFSLCFGAVLFSACKCDATVTMNTKRYCSRIGVIVSVLGALQFSIKTDMDTSPAMTKQRCHSSDTDDGCDDPCLCCLPRDDQ